ncbi:MAG TPA: 4Fe-4S dicluster domain-containing protein [Gemmatimonadaceae bacterium]|nr:4Fe-4S dicluster domain-containing protein [Gemmatimonadaceae bacterium]
MRDSHPAGDRPFHRRDLFARGLARVLGRAVDAATLRVAPMRPLVDAIVADQLPIRIDESRCITFRGVECGVCARVCPVGPTALTLDGAGRPAAGAACTACGACIDACVTAPSSIERTRRENTA